MICFELETHSPEQTEALGRLLAKQLRPGHSVALWGDLGTGKTCLVRGLASVIAGAAAVHSPTFTLVNEYRGTTALYHLDLYRLRGAEDLADIGYDDIVGGEGIAVLEWADRAEGRLPTQRLEIHIRHGGGDRRLLRIEDHGILSSDFPRRLQQLLTEFSCRTGAGEL